MTVLNPEPRTLNPAPSQLILWRAAALATLRVVCSGRSACGGDSLDTQRRLSQLQRLSLAGLGVAGAVLLLTARWLSPDQRGMGTHEQLGLAPCAFSVWTGWRCPSCGMTTAWAHAVRGELTAALQANAGGTLLCGFVAVGSVWAAASSLAGRWMIVRPSLHWLLWIGSGWLAITILDWLRKLVAG